MSDERGKKNGVEEEVERIDHFYHHHPLTLDVVGTSSGQCYGCTRYIYLGQTAYRCGRGCSSPILHQECAEMPTQIRLQMHPHCTLTQKGIMRDVPTCAVCEKGIYLLGYYCSSCNFQVHVGCAQKVVATPSCIQHPSHPHHLKLLGRSCLTRCDACGTLEKGSSYLCIDCQYWIHDSCASLHAAEDFHHHHHPLSLIYHLPLEYIRFDFKCDICLKDLVPRFWAYHCATCRYVVHIKCATRPSSTTTMNIDANATEDEDVIVFPAKNAFDEAMRSFLTNVGVAMGNPNEIMNGGYKFHSHDHELHLISSSIIDEEEEEDDNYDDGIKYGELVCDGCIMPIFPNKQKSSSSSSVDKYYYMSCGECKYFLHWECFHLPPELPSHRLHLEPDHNLTLQTSHKLQYIYCYICSFHTNGLFYRCTKCDFKADIKCISLPNTIKHEAHRRHPLKLLSTDSTNNSNYWGRLCRACGHGTHGRVCYRCEICEFIVHASCAQLPTVVSNPEWDRHPLPLTYDASVDHPSGFYCDICEKEMNPKRWMYHCRSSDFSVHPHCYPPASGLYRNIKFRQRYSVVSEHHHPLRYQLLTAKLKCDVCGRRKDYGSRGFQCTSHNCGFFMCLFPCGRDRQHLMQLAGC